MAIVNSWILRRGRKKKAKNNRKFYFVHLASWHKKETLTSSVPGLRTAFWVKPILTQFSSVAQHRGKCIASIWRASRDAQLTKWLRIPFIFSGRVASSLHPLPWWLEGRMMPPSEVTLISSCLWSRKLAGGIWKLFIQRILAFGGFSSP